MPFDFQEGQPFPDFEFPGVSLANPAKTPRIVSNQTLRGTPFVLWVYPKDATSGCTIEAREFAALHEDLEKEGVEVLGLSRDSLGSHEKFLSAQQLPFSLLSDKNGAWLQDHGLLFDAKMYGKPVTKVARTSFFVDAQGVLERVWTQVSPAGHGAQVLEAVRQIKAARSTGERSRHEVFL